MRIIWPVLIVMSSLLLAQTEIYRDACIAALEDGHISEEEQRILNSIQKSLDLSEDEVLDIQHQIMSGTAASPGISRAGRRLVIVQNMTLGQTLYGIGIPYLLGVESGSAYAGMQLLAFAGGFYITSQYTREMDLPIARATFQNAGSVLGLTSLYPLVVAVGEERWSDFDPEGKIALTYAMASVPAGIVWGDRLYRRWKPSDGQALAIVEAGALGSLHALGIHLVLTPEDRDLSGNWRRTNSLLVYGSYVGGMHLGRHLIAGQSLTMGDAYFISLSTGLGVLAGLELIALAEPSPKAAITTLLLTSDIVTLAAFRLAKSHELTTGDAAVIGLGSFAGFASLRGISLIMGMDQTNKALLVADIAGYLGGGYLTFRFIQPQRVLTEKRSNKVKLSLLPNYSRLNNRITVGMNAQLRF